MRSLKNNETKFLDELETKVREAKEFSDKIQNILGKGKEGAGTPKPTDAGSDVGNEGS